MKKLNYQFYVPILIVAILLVLPSDVFSQNIDISSGVQSQLSTFGSQIYKIAKWVCGLIIGGALISIAYKMFSDTQNKNLKLEIIFIIVFIAILFAIPSILKGFGLTIS